MLVAADDDHDKGDDYFDDCGHDDDDVDQDDIEPGGFKSDSALQHNKPWRPCSSLAAGRNITHKKHNSTFRSSILAFHFQILAFHFILQFYLFHLNFSFFHFKFILLFHSSTFHFILQL